jgi:arylsulfatase A-like enzyme
MNKNKNQRLSTRNQRIKTDASFLMRCMAGIILTAFLCSGCSRKKHKDPPSHGKPNIIFILSDDMGYGDAQAFNPQSQIPIPNIDRLASEGMRFTDAHAAAPWCLPSRYGLLTGQYPFRRSTGTGWRNHSIIKADQPTLATLLDKRGYRTGIIGKWHEGFNKFSRWIHNGAQGPLNGGPIDRGFDYYYGIPASLDMAPYLYIKNDSAVHPPTDSTAGHHTKGVTAIQGAFWRRGKIAPGFKFSQVLPHLTRKALEFIDRNAHSGYPFFLYFALTAPHTPWVPTKQFQGSSGVGMYGDFCVEVDYEVGRIMKKVAQEGIKDNTILIFSSDNGPVWFKADVKRTGHRGTAMLRGMKMDSWEGGIGSRLLSGGRARSKRILIVAPRWILPI